MAHLNFKTVGQPCDFNGQLGELFLAEKMPGVTPPGSFLCFIPPDGHVFYMMQSADTQQLAATDKQRLVIGGVEENPGPPKRGSSRTRVVTVRTRSTSARNAPKSKRKPKQKQMSSGIGGTIQTIIAPVSRGIRQVLGQPRISGNPYKKGGIMQVYHKELISEVTIPYGDAFSPICLGSTSGGIYNFMPVNPGAVNTVEGAGGWFTWLQPIAAQFERYRFKFLKFSLRTEAPTVIGGTVMLAFDPNVQDTSPLNKASLYAFRNCVRAPPWVDCALTVPKDDLKGVSDWLYVATSWPDRGQQPTPATGDLKTYFLGKVHAAAQGVASGVVSSLTSEFWCEYAVEFKDPVAAGVNPVFLDQGPQHVAFNDRSGTVLAANIFSNVDAEAPNGNVIASAVINSLFFSNKGKHLVSIRLGRAAGGLSLAFGGTALNSVKYNVAESAGVSALLQVDSLAGQTLTLIANIDFEDYQITVTKISADIIV